MRLPAWFRLWRSKRAYSKWEKSLAVSDDEVKFRDLKWLLVHKPKRDASLMAMRYEAEAAQRRAERETERVREMNRLAIAELRAHLLRGGLHGENADAAWWKGLRRIAGISSENPSASETACFRNGVK